MSADGASAPSGPTRAAPAADAIVYDVDATAPVSVPAYAVSRNRSGVRSGGAATPRTLRLGEADAVVAEGAGGYVVDATPLAIAEPAPLIVIAAAMAGLGWARLRRG